MVVTQKYTQPEYAKRFGDLASKYILNFGPDLVCNLDSLKEQKIDSKVFSIVLELWLKLKTVVLHSDFCSQEISEIKTQYDLVVV